MTLLLDAIFLKGYQWPFDPRKTKDYGSSLIDLLVYQETAIKGRQVFLDYRRNPSGSVENGKRRVPSAAAGARSGRFPRMTAGLKRYGETIEKNGITIKTANKKRFPPKA